MTESLAELGAIVHCLAEIERERPGSGAKAAIEKVLRAQLRTPTAAELRAHFEHVPGRKGEPHWCRIPGDGVAIGDDGTVEFEMGSPRDEEGHLEREEQVLAAQRVPFWMAATPITIEQFELMLPGRVHTDHRERWKQAKLVPVTNVSWFEAVLFTHWLQLHRQLAGDVFAGVGGEAACGLPSEAQWEYACRAGTSTRFWAGDEDGDLARVGWFIRNSDGRLHRVAEREDTANPWGYDVHGNVWEWCADWFGDRLVPGRRTGPKSGAQRVQRGGSYRDTALDCRSACRFRFRPDSAGYDSGFRVCLSVPE